MDKHAEVFKEEAYEHLSEIETSLLELEDDPEDSALIDRVFRSMHTIKGSGSMFGFDDIAAFTHEVETVLDMVRDGKIKVTKELIDVTLAARDHIRVMLDSYDGGESADEKEAEKIIASFRSLIPEGEKGTSASESSSQEKENASETSGERTTYRIYFRPHQDIFTKGTNPILLLNELRELGNCKMLASTKEIPALEEYNSEACYVAWDIFLTTDKSIDILKDVFIFVEDECELKIDAVDVYGKEGDFDQEECKKIGEILVERGDITHEDLEKSLKGQKRIGEMLVDSGLVEREKIESALTEQQHIKEERQKQKNTESASSIRVASDKLDKLIDLVGELVTAQAGLSQTAAKKRDPELVMISEGIERLTAELRDNTMSIRMLPIGTTFSKFRRLVRDLSSELKKEIEMSTEGAETELDKTLIEMLNDPMVHLIRNSIDHGIESPEEREALGKPRQGTIYLSAVHSGANVLITIRDDGYGLDREKIYAKALEKGLIAPNTELSEKEIFSLILMPGFSTSDKVTKVSGRGVGMDVVKRSIDSLRGSIDINSEKGVGTTITLKLPLTLAIIEGLLIMIKGEYFILPLSAVEECVEFTREDKIKANGRRLVKVRGELVPFIDLREQFKIKGETPEIEQIVIINIEDFRIGFVVDQVVGEHQTVIKSLGRAYKNVEGISGATTLGDGTIALILDPQKLLKMVEQKEENLSLAS